MPTGASYSKHFCSQHRTYGRLNDAPEITDYLPFLQVFELVSGLFCGARDFSVTLKFWLICTLRISEHHVFANTVLSANARAVMGSDFGTPHRDARFGHKICIST